jgi:hypothetical protein
MDGSDQQQQGPMPSVEDLVEAARYEGLRQGFLEGYGEGFYGGVHASQGFVGQACRAAMRGDSSAEAREAGQRAWSAFRVLIEQSAPNRF